MLPEGIKIPVTENVNVTINLIKKAISFTNCTTNFSQDISEELNDFINSEIEFDKYSNNAIINNIAKLIYGRGLKALDASAKPND